MDPRSSRHRPSRRTTCLVLAALVGVLSGYVGEARAGDAAEFSARSGASRNWPAGDLDRTAGEHGHSRVLRSRGIERLDGGGLDARRSYHRASDRRYGASVSAEIRKSFNHRRGKRDFDGAVSRFETHGSITFVQPIDPFANGGVYPTFDDVGESFYGQNAAEGGIAFRGSTDYFQDEDFFSGDAEAERDGLEAEEFAASGPKIIDIATQRLDRRAVPPGGLEVVDAGGTKIIRLAPDYRRSAQDASAGLQAENKAVRYDLQPWSGGWLRYCTKAYHSFDPELGTYVDRGGRVRFCSAD